jgi:hypothetical protein
MSMKRRHLKSIESTTTDATPTPILVLPQLPEDGSFAFRGTVLARNVTTGAVVTFFPVNSGSITGGTVTQNGGTSHAAPCKTAPADGGTAQGFAPPGCSTLTTGAGLTVGFAISGRVAELVVTGLVATPIRWALTGDLTLQSNAP